MRFFYVTVFTSVFNVSFAERIVAGTGEFMAGAMYQKINYEEPEVTEYGLSLRYRHLFSEKAGGMPFIHADFMGLHVLLADLAGGYLYRSSGNTFFDAGAGLGYSYLYGVYFQLFTGIGFKIGSRLHISLPFLLQYPARGGIFIYPLIGWKF